MIASVLVKNLRALVETPQISLRKINVLVGKNSSGKSTFLRLFPLLRQSVEVETKTPILWYGRFVDFGTFYEARNNRSNQSSITFCFEVATNRVPTLKRPGLIPFGNLYRNPGRIQLLLELGTDADDRAGYPKRIEIKINSDVISFGLTASIIKTVDINGKAFTLPGGGAFINQLGGLVPNLLLLHAQKSESGEPFLVIDNVDVKEEIVQKLYLLAHANTSHEKLQQFAGRLTYADPQSFFKSLVESPFAPPSLRARIRDLGASSELIEQVRLLTLVATMSRIMRDLLQSLVEFAVGVRYVEPVRASAERYYRLQDLAVDEIDSRGANTAMFLNSLTDATQEKLQAWMKSNFGFYAYTDRSEGHVAVKLAFGEEERGRNIADLGFGYSQVLPIILQLWCSCVGYSDLARNAAASRKPSMVAMEQPELHLHPSYQALIADVLVASAENAQPALGPIPLVVETHSEHLINRLGELVANNSISPRDVQILLFEEENGVSTVKPVRFDGDGVLQAPWPIGFFVPSL